MLRFFERGNTAVLSFNFHGMCQEVQFLDDERNVYIWDDLEIPCYNILADHPFYYYKLLSQRPVLYTQLSIDLDHEAFMKRFFPEVKMGPFLPLAGTELSRAVRDGHETILPGLQVPDSENASVLSSCPQIKDRSLDVVFTGNFASPKRFEKYITRLNDEYTAFYYEIIHDLLNAPLQTVESVVEKYLRREISDLSEEDLKQTMQNITFIDLYVRYHARGKAVKALVDNGVKVHVFGDKWNELDCLHPENLIDGDSVYSVECLEKIRDSKISLNVLPWFRQGPHDRIYNTMLQKSVCLTDSNPWLDAYLTDGENSCIYSLTETEKLPYMVKELLSNSDKCQYIADNGYRLGLKNTWTERMKVFSSYLESQSL